MRAGTFMILFFLLFTFSKEHCMADQLPFEMRPIDVPIPKTYVSQLFPTLEERSIGVVKEDEWAILTMGTDQSLDWNIFPKKVFDVTTAKALPQKRNDLLFVKGNKGIFLLDFAKKELSAEYIDISKSIDIGMEQAKVIDHAGGIVLGVFDYFLKNGIKRYEFVLDDVFNAVRLKVRPLESPARSFPVYFTPSYAFFRENWESPWKALDNSLSEVSHPLVDLLNEDPSDSVVAVLDDNMHLSEKHKHAFIITYSQAVSKDQLFLASWHSEPKFTPIPVDSSMVAGGRRLVKSPNCNTMSPSGKWVYFATDGGDHLKDTHYLIYLDPAIPGGFLPPMRLPIEGHVDVSGWMTTPEGLVLHKDEQLLYWDLSKVDPAKL